MADRKTERRETSQAFFFSRVRRLRRDAPTSRAHRPSPKPRENDYMNSLRGWLESEKSTLTIINSCER